LAQRDHLLFEVGGSFARLMMRGTGKFDQTARSLLLKAAQPFTYGRRGGLKEAGGGLHAMLASVGNETQAMIVSTLHFPHQGEVRSRHGSRL
jgi:hypothetical protein